MLRSLTLSLYFYYRGALFFRTPTNCHEHHRAGNGSFVAIRVTLVPVEMDFSNCKEHDALEARRGSSPTVREGSTTGFDDGACRSREALLNSRATAPCCDQVSPVSAGQSRRQPKSSGYSDRLWKGCVAVRDSQGSRNSFKVAKLWT